MLWMGLAVANNPVLLSPDVLRQQVYERRVRVGHDPACAPDVLRRAGRAVIDPAALPVSLTSNGITRPDVERTIEDLRAMVVSWVVGLSESGDASLGSRQWCVGLWNDTSGPNSFAWNGQSIYVGIRDLASMHQAHGAGLPATVEYTMAHEFGHVLQQSRQMRFAGATARQGELHADCLAGYFMGMDRDPTFSRVTQLVASSEAFRIGDHHTGDPQHHGTPIERRSAFERGWAAGQLARQPEQRQSVSILGICSLFASP